MKRIDYLAVTEMGATVYGSIEVSDDPTMAEIVRELKRRGFKMFKVEGMKKLIKMPW